jgi:hypothetical protein
VFNRFPFIVETLAFRVGVVGVVVGVVAPLICAAAGPSSWVIFH